MMENRSPAAEIGPDEGIDFSRQTECARPDLVLPRPLTAAEARLRLKEYKLQRDRRVEVLKAVLSDNGVLLGRSLEEIVRVTDLFLRAARKSALSGPKEFSGEFVEFLWNFGQFLGDCTIDLAPRGVLRWIVEDVAVKNTTKRFVFTVSGYAGASQTFNPDKFLLQLARASADGQDVSPLIVIAEINRIKRLENWSPSDDQSENSTT